MKKFSFVFLIIILFLTGCVSQNMVVEEPVSDQPPMTYSRFINALTKSNVREINLLLGFHCEFKEYPGMKGWYGFYRNNVLMIGPFPLKDYRNSQTLALTRPAGYRQNDFSRFHVFSQSYDLYLYFGPDSVWIEGSGISDPKQAKMFVY